VADRSYAAHDHVFSNGRSKEGKKRTFEAKKTDTVLNPESSKEKGIGIRHRIEKSPDNMLSEHPRSDPNSFCFYQTQVVLQKKKSVWGQEKNRSTLTHSASRGEIMPSKEASLEKTLTSQKRHYSRYTDEFFSSPFRTNPWR
jgi:hypothetical protein